MAGATADGFFDLTSADDIFQVVSGLLVTLPKGLRGLEGNDLISGSEDAEMLNGNVGDDTLFGAQGNDTLWGGKDFDFLSGGSGDDFLKGGQGNDQLLGEEGNDSLQGGKGNDLLSGGEGNDRLMGDLGSDTLRGGNGEDIFVLSQNTVEADSIVDFDPTSDRIGFTGGLQLTNLLLEPGSLAGGSDTLIKLQDGSILAWVLGVSPVAVRDRLFSFDTPSNPSLNPTFISSEPLTPTPIRINLDSLPQPLTTRSTSNPAQIIPIPNHPVLKVPPGFTVNVFADNLDRPRWLAVTPTGDILVTETPNNRIRLLRDSDGNGTADISEIFAGPENGLTQPFGMAFADNSFFLGNRNSILRFPYTPGQTQLTGTGQKIADLPGGDDNQHWTRNLAIDPENQKLYVSIGSISNADPEPLPRASVQVMNLDGSNQQTFASGLRNPVGLDFQPIAGKLYTTVNERDGLGDDLVPDYLTGLQAGEFYGWPYVYLTPGRNDPRLQGDRPEFISRTRTPDVLFQAHSAPLGLQFYDGSSFPEKYRNGAFVAFHGSWNRSQPTGYKIVFAPFTPNGQAIGSYEDFLTGFLSEPDRQTTWGRPTGLQVIADGSLLLTDEVNNRIYRVQYGGQ